MLYGRPVAATPPTRVDLYTDGACSKAGPGAWAAILVCDGREVDLKGSERDTTHNRMELTAVIKGLQALRKSCDVTVTTDSRYVLNPFERGWLQSWKRRAINGVWLTADRKPVKNQELWEQLEAEVDRHRVTWVWVRGHNGHSYNERCDRLAVAEYQALLRP